MKIYIKYTLLFALGLIACDPEFDNPVEDLSIISQSSGTADFSTYVSLGNSLTAGFSDGSLYIDGQNTSFAHLIAQQMKTAGGGEFKTPFMADNLGGFADISGFNKRLVFDATTRTPTIIEGTSTTNAATVLSGPFNNMGVPGAKSFHLGVPGYGQANPYFGRFSSTPTASIINDALSQNPTFFSLWIGGNDVLSYATSGGVGVNQLTNLDPSTYGMDDITNTGVFAQVYNNLITSLTANGAKGIIANIPDIKSLPFFTTIPFNPVPLNSEEAASTNSAYAAYNMGLQGAVLAGALSPEEATQRTIQFQAGQNAAVIIDENLTDLGAINSAFLALPQLRQTTAQDLLILPAASFIGTRVVKDDPTTTNGIAIPLADNWILTPEEQAEITTATNSFNASIEAIANANGLAFLDAASILEELKSGIPFGDGGLLTSGLNNESAFSLDGIHLNPRGNAEITNRFIEAINTTYGSTLLTIDPSSFKTITLK